MDVPTTADKNNNPPTTRFMFHRTGSITSLLPRSAKYRHVVFADDVYPARRPRDFGPPLPKIEPTDSAEAGNDRLSAEDESFIRWLLERAELDVRDYKPETLRRRVQSCLRVIRAGNTAHARHMLQRTPALIPVAIDSLIIGVTSFFRDPAVFDFLARNILPSLAERAGGIRVWSVGCSDGSELYSVAMLLAEQRILHRCYLLGSDCRTDAIKRASAGVYDLNALRGIPTEMIRRYFVAANGAWRVQPWLRTVVQFRTANVLKLLEPGLFDLILCRNMAIYFQGDAMVRLWGGIENSVRSGGVVVMGKAERPVGAKRLLPVGPCIYRRSRG